MKKKGPKARPAFDRFVEKIKTESNSPDACWIWTGGSVKSRKERYGTFCPNPIHGQPSKKSTAHRFSYEQFVGPIPDGYHIDHLCDNTLCVNPEHLEAVTPAENNRRSNSVSAINQRKTHCPEGHAYSEHGQVNPTTGKRRCKTCSNAKALRYYYRHKGANAKRRNRKPTFHQPK